MFEKILVANRGEIALRILRTCREMEISTVAVHSAIDRSAPHVLAADEAVALGGDEPAESYLNMDRIIQAAGETGAQAIHPGYGFLAENAEFAERCRRAGKVFIGPPPEALAAAGDKTKTRRLAAEVGVPYIPGTLEPSADLDSLRAEAEGLGFPVMLKAAAGGGGKGMRKIDHPDELAEALDRAASEARAAFGDGRLYLEKCIEDPRHVEVQLLLDDRADAVHLFERECSIQRRHQKIIEEAPSPAVDERLRERICQAAVEVARAAGYRNAGTVEFLLDADGSFYFIEVNARLQVEHPVTELITGLDLVGQQILLASGRALEFDQTQVRRRGHAIECRIYAEDARQGFMPSPGDILRIRAPAGPGVRFDCGVEPGSSVPVEYDPLLAKLITWGEDRDQAIARMARALGETSILGVHTPVEMLLDVVRSEPFRQGQTTTGFLPAHFSDWRPAADRVDTLLLGWLVAELEGLGRAATPDAGATEPTGWDPWKSLGHWRLGG